MNKAVYFCMMIVIVVGVAIYFAKSQKATDDMVRHLQSNFVFSGIFIWAILVGCYAFTLY
jgi:hypothetical protein